MDFDISFCSEFSTNFLRNTHLQYTKDAKNKMNRTHEISVLVEYKLDNYGYAIAYFAYSQETHFYFIIATHQDKI